jgi:hypothetical protein
MKRAREGLAYSKAAAVGTMDERPFILTVAVVSQTHAVPPVVREDVWGEGARGDSQAICSVVVYRQLLYHTVSD